MKTRYKFIHFAKCNPSSKGWLWGCLNNKDKDIMGVIIYYKPWKQHVIEFREGCVFNNSCLEDIIDFLGQLNRQEK